MTKLAGPVEYGSQQASGERVFYRSFARTRAKAQRFARTRCTRSRRFRPLFLERKRPTRWKKLPASERFCVSGTEARTSAVWSGSQSCRTGEILTLEWSSVDLLVNPMTASIVSTVINGTEGLTIQQKTKSDKSRRTLKLPRFAEQMLRRRKSEAVGELVFPSSTGTVRAPANFLLQWHAALKGTEFEGAIPKTFRSTVATLVSVEAGANMAKEQLGHGSQAVTDKHYIKPTHQGPDVTDTLELFNASAKNHE